MTLNKQEDIFRLHAIFTRDLCAGGFWYMQRWRGILKAPPTDSEGGAYNKK